MKSGPKRVCKKTINAVELAYLTDTDLPESDKWGSYTLICFRHGLPGLHNQTHPRVLWNQEKAEYLPLFIEQHPGCRPIAWWQWDSPEPRLRLGGVGSADFEFLNVKPCFEKGVPVFFITPFQVEYYNGRARNVNTGELIPCKWKDGDFKGIAYDPSDPPQYESEAQYLQRLNLLTPSEKKVLKIS